MTDYLRGVALSIIVLSLPALSVGMAWLFFITPLPLIYFPIALGFDKGFKIILHATLISVGIAFVTGTIPVLLFSFSLMPAGFILARSLNRKEPILGALGQGTVALGLIWLLAGSLLGAVNQVNLYQEVVNQLDAGLVGAYEAYNKAPEIPLEAKAELQAIFPGVRTITIKLLPGILATMTLTTTWLNIVLANWLLNKKGVAGWGDAGQWRLPDSLVWIFIAAGLFLFIPGTMNTIGANVMLVMVTLYFMQGYEVFNHLCLKWSVPKAIRLLLLFVLIIQAYGFILLALLGLADIWANFRKPITIAEND